MFQFCYDVHYSFKAVKYAKNVPESRSDSYLQGALV